MKHVRSLTKESSLLTRYRASYPTEQQRPASEARDTWDGFKTDSDAYRQLLEELTKVQQGLCIYCEQRLVDSKGNRIPNDYQVEHVLPKSGDVGRVLDWQNLALACVGGTYRHHPESSRQYTSTDNTSCGQTKLDKELPCGCDPRTFPLLNALVEVDMQGNLLPNQQHCTAAGVQWEDVEAAIELLKLNCERLRKARQNIADSARSWFVFMLEELLHDQLDAAQKQQFVDLLVARRLQPDAGGYLPPFWSAERCAIGVPAESWLVNNVARFT